jgi:hypothetical protein
MDSNDCIVGTNWNVHLCGYEIDPPDLKQELERELENVG